MGNGNRQSRSKSPARGRRVKAPAVRPQSDISPKLNTRVARAAAAPALADNTVRARLKATVDKRALEIQDESRATTRSGSDRDKRARSRSVSRADPSPSKGKAKKKKKKKSKKVRPQVWPQACVLVRMHVHPLPFLPSPSLCLH